MNFPTKYTTLSIPVDEGDQLGSGYGLVEVEPVDRSFDSYSVDLIKSATYRMDGGKVVASIALPNGRYVARLRTPSGDRITKLIQVIDGEAEQEVKAITTSRIASRANSFDPFGLLQATRATMDRLSNMTVQILEDLSGVGGLGVTSPTRGPLKSTVSSPTMVPPSFELSMMEMANAAPPREPSPIQITVFGDNARDRMNAGLQAPAAGGGEIARWASAQLQTLLEFEGHGRLLPTEESAGGGAIANLTLNTARNDSEWYALVHSAKEGRNKRILVRIPRSWPPGGTESAEQCSLKLAATPAGPDSLDVQLAVPDQRLQAVLNFMQQTDLEAALSLVETSLELLYFKHDNPYAAAAAGYVLLAAPTERTPDAYYGWVSNLGKRFVELPDGCIQHATLLLQTALPPGLPEADFPSDSSRRYRAAYELLVESLCRGLPLYRSAFKLLVSNLRILEKEAALTQGQRDAMTAALHFVNQLRLRLDINQPFTIVDVSDLR